MSKIYDEKSDISPIKPLAIWVDEQYVKKYLLDFIVYLERSAASHFWLSELNEDERNLIEQYMKEKPFVG